MRVSRRSNLDRFLRAVRRRHIVLRAMERTGLGTLGGCGVALVLLPLLVWQGRSTLGPCAAALCAGAALGLVWGVTRRPSVLDAAMEADRQLGLQDLLGTALAVGAGRAGKAGPHRDDPDNPWAAGVVAVAEGRCRGLAPSSVLLHRLGARAWGGIGLATTLVFTLALLTGPEPVSRAAQARGGADEGGRPPDLPDKPLLAVPVSSQRPAPAGGDNDAAREGGHTATDTANATGAKGDGPDRPAEANGSASPRQASGGTPDGGGAGSARTNPRDPGRRPPDAAPAGGPDSSRPPGTGDSGRAGGGGRAADPTSAGNAGQSAGTATGGTGPHVTPPWQGDRWAQDVQRARQALDAGEVPPAYRDLVRKYFERQ